MTNETLFKAKKIADEIEDFRLCEAILSAFTKNEKSGLKIEIKRKPFDDKIELCLASDVWSSCISLDIRYNPPFINELKSYIKSRHIELKQEFENL